MSDAVTRERLFAAARAASSLDQANICTIYAIEETPDGKVFIVMPAHEGETLQANMISRVESDA